MKPYVLAVANGTDDDISALGTAVLATQELDAFLEVLHVRTDVNFVLSTALGAGYRAGPDLAELLDRLTQDVERCATRARQHFDAICGKLASAGGATDNLGTVKWSAETGEQFSITSARAQLANVVVVSRGTKIGSMPDGLPCSLAMKGRRPVLLAPPTPPKSLSDTVAIAWNGSNEAGQAVMAAMPFIERCRRLVVLVVREGDDDELGDAADPIPRALRVRRPDLELVRITPGTRPGAAAMLASATRLGATLLVTGAYGHARMQELFFGGFTRHVMRNAELPVLLSH